MSFFINASKYYKAEPHQDRAWEELEAKLPTYLLEEFQQAYRARDEPSSGSIDNSWGGIYLAATIAGAKYPECVAAQWALESGWGKYTSGQNNYFGIKGKGTKTTTWEDYGAGAVTIVDEFKDFNTIQDCINDLVNKWYLDYKGYKGVNRANSRDDCAYLLKAEGYATDPKYPNKLINLMNSNS